MPSSRTTESSPILRLSRFSTLRQIIGKFHDGCRNQASPSSSPYRQDECNGDFATVTLSGLESAGMLPRKCRLAVLVLSLSSLAPVPCSAGPLKRPEFAFCSPDLLHSAPNPFPRPALFPSFTQTIFHLNAADLSHVITPPEFYGPNPKAANVTRSILQATPSSPDNPHPCRVYYRWYGYGNIE